MLELNVTDRPREEAARVLSEWLAAYKDTPVLLLLSGGSALSFLHLARIPQGASVAVSMLDERFSVDPTINNFIQLSQTPFFADARERGVVFLPTIPEDGESLQTFTARLNTHIARWRSRHRDGVVLVTQGIGNDGHTAGILPLPENPTAFEQLFSAPHEPYVGYEAPKGSTPFRERVTVTLSFLKNTVARSLVFVIGREKSVVLQKLLARRGDVTSAPMMALHEMQKVTIITDRDP